jgi:hypothetical protein
VHQACTTPINKMYSPTAGWWLHGTLLRRHFPGTHNYPVVVAAQSAIRRIEGYNNQRLRDRHMMLPLTAAAVKPISTVAKLAPDRQLALCWLQLQTRQQGLQRCVCQRQVAEH